MTDIPRIDDAVLAHFRDAGTGLVTDAAGRLGVRSWMEGITPMVPTWRLCGRARPVKFAPRSGMKRPAPSIYEILRSFSPGDVAIFAGLGTPAFILGENLVHQAIYARLGGIVADGRTRDSAEICALPLPVFATGVSVHPFHAELEIVACDVPVVCGGAPVRPGDMIVGDADGVVVVPQEAVPAFATEVDDMAVLEDEQERALRAGVPLEELFALIARKKKRKGPALDNTAPANS